MLQTRTWLIINSVACVLAFLPAFGVQMATVMGGASAQAQGLLAVVVAIAVVVAFALPWTFVISLIGSWLTYAADLPRVALSFAAFPWILLLALVVAMAIIIFNA